MRWAAGAAVLLTSVLALGLGDLPAIRISAWACVVLAAVPALVRGASPGAGAGAELAAQLASAASFLGTLAVLWVRPLGMFDVRNDGSALLTWSAIEVLALCLLSLWRGRRAPRWPTLLSVPLIAAGGFVAARLVPDQTVGVQLFIGALCASPVAGANALGRYLSTQDRQREQAVRAARLRQRRELALDLHDYVAHDVAAIAVVAQAGRGVGGEAASESLARIEQAASRALDSLTRSIEALAGEGPSPPGLAAIEPLVAEFERPVRLVDGSGRHDAVPEAVQSAAYRVVVEGLNNVRRHAAGTPEVTVTLDREPAGLLVSVHNGPGTTQTGTTSTRTAPSDPGRRSGLGLPGLAERVAERGGTLEACAHEDGGWSLTAYLPILPP